MVLHRAASFRSASGCLDLIREYLPRTERTPTAWCGQLWLMRIGLYEMYRAKEEVTDRVWIVDHTVQIGTTKCLLIVGIRLSVWERQRRPLKHDDLEVLALEPVEHSDGKTVLGQLEWTAELTGVPRAILSDQGTDLKRGIAAFQQRYPGTAGVQDIAHKLANLLKHELEADERWSQFLEHLGRTKPQVRQTALAFLSPPSPQSKARYMNLEELVRWSAKALAFLDRPRLINGAGFTRQKLREKFGWLEGFREELRQWDGLLRLVAETLNYVRHHGYHRHAASELKRHLQPLLVEAPSRQFAKQILMFVRDQSASAAPGEHLVGSSEVLESLIGTGKRLARQQSKSGFTKLLLATAAAVAKPTTEYLVEAFRTVQTEDVYEWARDVLGPTVQSQRRLALS